LSRKCWPLLPAGEEKDAMAEKRFTLKPEHVALLRAALAPPDGPKEDR
jgi:hypothetical protein